MAKPTVNVISDDKLKMINDYGDHSIEELDPILGIRTRPSMYIGYIGMYGELHCIKELLHNIFDEGNIENAICDECYISYDVASRKYIIEDNGRGIPPNRIEDACTKIHAGGKFNKVISGFGMTAGTNGVGMTAVNALADSMSFYVYRGDGYEYTIHFEKGILTKPLAKKKIKDLRHGTRIEVVTDRSVLGDYEYDVNALVEMVHMHTYVAPLNMNIELHVLNNNGVDIHKKYKNKRGLEDLLLANIETPIIKPITGSFVFNKTQIDEKDKICEFMFTFDANRNTPFIGSYSNFCYTKNGGTHVDGFDDGVCRFFTSAIKANLTEREKKANIIPSYLDVRASLALVIHTQHEEPLFHGQGKEQITNVDFVQFVSHGTRNALTEWKKNNPTEFQKVEKYIKELTKLRLKMGEEKGAIIKNNAPENIFNLDLPNGFKRAVGGSPDINEVYLIEGISAGGLVADARDVMTQAVIPLRGVPKNTWKDSLTGVRDNREFRSIVTALGTGIGPNFDISKLKYNKICLLTDADIDGHKIFSLTAAFFLYHMRPIVEGGYLYKCMPPLYRIKNGNKNVYVRTKSEYIEYVEDCFTNSNMVASKDKTILNKKAVLELLLRNRQYLDMINAASSKNGIHPLLLEYIFYTSTIDGIRKGISKRFRFMKATPVGNGIYLDGTIDSQAQAIVVNETLFKSLKSISSLIFETNKGEIEYILNDKPVTLYEMLLVFKSYEPSDVTRYKGIGEMNPEELWETTMNPATRTLIRLTIEDLETEVARFDILHGNEKQQRKEMMEMFKIDIEDIDN